MAFPNRLLTPPTWRLVGLGLTTTIFALGALAIVSPAVGAESLGVIPTTLEGREVAGKGMIFLGVRDLAAAGALYWYYFEGKQKEMGVLTLAWTLVCVVDTWVATQGPKGWDSGIWTLCGGAAAVTFVGLGLVQS
ncbi:uncharacterized protein PAC_18767 [Phialocephala subalpina]|uniref:Integral membrane protein n=1 Tax=Phialocephala subalpina TaxID=576137 RepID=A0A1L7XV35_9HELO|nr:uncharacterized protein PAC_18767 [Phialocephala subalpina]